MRLAAVVFAFALLAGPAAAQPAPPQQSPEVLSRVYACADIADSAQRLACFDGAVAAMRTAESQGQFAAVDSQRVQQIEREAFGFSLPSLPRLGLPGFRRQNEDGAGPVVTEEMAMTIRNVGRFDGRPSFIMENGQTWVQVDTEANRFIRPGATVKIRRASMGSYLMSVDRGGPGVRVRRAE